MKIFTMLITLLLLSSFALADHTHEHTEATKKAMPTLSPSISVEQNEVLVQVHGIVCSFCAHGLQKKLSKLKFVDRSKHTKGIYVDIEKQKVLIAIMPDQKPNLKKILSKIKSGGYEAVAIYTNPDGKITIVEKVGKE